MISREGRTENKTPWTAYGASSGGSKSARPLLRQSHYQEDAAPASHIDPFMRQQNVSLIP
jgi:hypothetical protein